MITVLLVRRYLGEYVRRPLNLILLVLVPVIFVWLAASTIADFATLVGGVTDPAALAAPTAGWAAAFLSGVAGFFLVLGSREPDRRLANAGMGPARVVTARLGSGLVLAFLSAFGALIALALRTGLGNPVRTVGGTLMFAIVYLAIGAATGALVKNAVNGSLVVIFVWMLDVFLGPAMAGGSVWITRVFPSHFVTLVMIDSASGHAGPIGDIGWALLWTLGGLAVAGFIFYSATRSELRRPTRRAPAWWRRSRAAFIYGFREYRRNTAMWVLLVLLPIFFISLSFYITPDQPAPIRVIEGGVAMLKTVSMMDLHGAIMVPITVAFLAGLAGLFVVQDSIEADGRLALAGFRPWEILVGRIGIIVLAGMITTVVSLGVTSLDFSPRQWGVFAIANALVAITYGLIGVLAGSTFGRLGGLYIMFLVPYIDVGIAQNVMFSAAPPAWGRFLPGHGSIRMLIDGAFTSSFDTFGAALLAVAWIVGLAFVAARVFNHISAPERV